MTSRPSRTYTVGKRVLDVAGAIMLLLFLSPLLGIVALWIWGEDGRPIFFTQIRAGRHGRPFRILKYRTLSTGPNDPTRPANYTTRSGAVLRRWGLDELPQLWNVIRGDMSLVGPRPPLPDDVPAYSAREEVRLDVRPGLTGWAQIHGRNALSWPERIDHDLWYVRNRSLSLDIRILAKTPLVLARGTGVNGPNGGNPRFRSVNGPNQCSS